MPAADEGMVYATESMALVAERLLTEPELLVDVRAEFDAAVAERPYDRPIPDGVLAPPLR
jgi:aminobenzoyl-glutamate utilization protein B